MKFVPGFVKEINKKQINTKEGIDKVFNKILCLHHIFPSKPEIPLIYDVHFQDIMVPLIFKKWVVRGAVRADSGVLSYCRPTSSVVSMIASIAFRRLI